VVACVRPFCAAKGTSIENDGSKIGWSGWPIRKPRLGAAWPTVERPATSSKIIGCVPSKTAVVGTRPDEGRAFRDKEGNTEQAVELMEKTRIYPLSRKDAPPRMVFPNGSGQPADMLYPKRLSVFREFGGFH
jgi:hypothetical protein